MSLPDPDAPLELTIEKGGRVLCRLPDHHGRLWSYEVRRTEGGVDFVHLEKQAPPRRVRKPPGRLTDCSCPWWHFQGRGRCLPCKHQAAAKRLDEAQPTLAQEITTVAAPKKQPDDQHPVGAAPGVYAAIARVARTLAQAGIAKSSVNEGQRFNFRGIDAVMNALATPLVEAGLLILPRVLSRQHSERPSNKGGTLICVSVEVAYDFVCVADGSRHEVVMHGEAMDSGDKATNKALSAAYKYACFQAFCIPTEAADDADAHSPEPGARPEAAPADWHRGLQDYDAKLAGQGLCKLGDLVKHVAAAGKKLGLPADMTAWDGEAVKMARAETQHFEQARRAQAQAKAS